MNIRHTFYRLSALLALLLGLAACTKSEEADYRLPEGEYPVVIRTTGLSAVATPASRATVDGDWQGVQTVALKMGDAVKEYTVAASDADGYKSATLSNAADPHYWTSRKPISVSAWWPLDDTDITRMPAVVVAEDQSTLDAFQRSDFISAEEQTVEFDNPTLEFTHRTARVAVELVPGTVFTDLAGADVSLTGLDEEGGNPDVIVLRNAEADTYEALVAPQTVTAGDVFIRMELANGVYNYIPQHDVVLEKGKRYFFTVRVNVTGLELVGCSIVGWNDGGGENGIAKDTGYIYDDATHTYTVHNADGLLAWGEAARNDLTLNCTLTADITLPAVADGESNWTPVGYYDSGVSVGYTGTFDGGGHTITGLTVDLPGQYYVGLFSVVGKEGTVQHLTLAGAKINGNWYVGGVAGYNYGTLTGCSASGNVKGTGNCVGGVAGDNNSGTIENCHFTSGTVTGTDGYVGGVAGYTYDGTVENCHFTSGTVSGTGDYVGGVAGRNYGGTVIACYATGDVSGNERVGGVVGYNSSGTVTACYATGDVTGTDHVGGVVGYYYGGGTLTACYATGDVKGNDYVGGVAGYYYGGGTLTACYWSNNLGTGIGYGSGDVTQVDGTAVTWENAQTGMNEAIDAWNNSHSGNPCNCHYEGATATTPPTLATAN